MKQLYRHLLAAALLLPTAAVQAQDTDVLLQNGLRVVRLEVQPAKFELETGQSVPLEIRALDANGRVVPVLFRYASPRGTVRVDAGRLIAERAGEFQVTASVILPGTAPVTTQPVSVQIPVVVKWPAVARVNVIPQPGRLYAGTTIRHDATVLHADNTQRPNAPVQWSTSNAQVATVDRFGFVTAHAPGDVVITAAADGVRGEKRYQVAQLPATRLQLRVNTDRVRTGDVVTLDARAFGASGDAITDVPMTFTYTYLADDSLKGTGAAGIIRDNKFVGELPGVYTIIANAGSVTARTTIDVRPREAVRPVTVVGRGNVTHVHTSDLWVFEGVDKRDYAVTGTWGGDGWSYFWDVTDPANMVKTDSIRIDARTINDVTVSPDARYAVLSREGASNRRNGVVILDLKNPAHPTIAANFDENLTGGVHNLFATNDYLFALSGGQKYIIIDVRDITAPKYVSEFGLPGAGVHDLFVANGLVYSSQWGAGIVMVDIGDGRWGGSIQKPKLVTNVPTPSGATHEVYMHHQKETGKVYVLAGDEIMSRRGEAWAGTNASLTVPGGVPQTMNGFTHIIDFTDPMNPQIVARYQVREFGTHDIAIEGDILYQSYYDGGLRMVDLSGELLGNLAEQGREIAVFKPFDPQGFTANAPMVMNVQPHKGHIFFTDFNSGLWSAKLQPKPKDIS